MAKPVTDTLRELRGGLVALNLSQLQQELVTAVQNSGKKGKLTISLTYEPHGKDNKEIHVTCKSAVSKPADPGLDERTIFFAARGDLLRDDPDQRSLGLHGVDDAATEAAAPADGASPAERKVYGLRGG